MNKAIDVVALGELLIDFTENGVSDQGNPIMEANPGGAPCNMLAMLAKQGHKAAFIGKVGNDMFGRQLKDAIIEVGIMTDGLVMDNEVNTTLAFVHNDENGDRDFSFYRNPGADMMLTKDEINYDLINNCKVFHYGSLSMTSECCFEATKSAIECAKKSGALISFDPNLREPLWKSLDEAKIKISYGLAQCDILKISDNEIQWFTGIDNYADGVEYLRNEYPNLKLILVSLGADGSMAFMGDKATCVAGFTGGKVIDTTGAGDTFCGSVLKYILDNGFRQYTEDELAEMLKYANAAAYLVTQKRGALRMMPSSEAIAMLRQSQ